MDHGHRADVERSPAEDFETWVRTHHPRLLGIARVVTGDPTLAQDVLQDCLVDLYRRWDHISGEGSNPLAYATRIMGSKAANHRRTAWGRRVYVTDDLALFDALDGDVSGPVNDRIVVASALQRLTSQQRQVIAMHYLLDMSVGEIAAELRKPVGTITSDLTRGRQRLRTDLMNRGEGGHGER